MDSQNIAGVFYSLNKYYDDERVHNFLRNNGRTLTHHYYNQVNSDLLYSDPIIVGDGTHEVSLQVKCLNIAFKDYLDGLIKDMVLREGLRPGNTQWDDGFYASSKGPLYDCPRQRLADTNTSKVVKSYDSGRYSASSTADDILNSWWYPRRPVEVRDDAVGAIGQTPDLRSRFPPQNTLTGDVPRGVQYVRGNVQTGPAGYPTQDLPIRAEKYTVQNPSYALHNSEPLTAAAVNIPTQYHYADPSDGAYYNVPKQEYVEVDRLLNTNMIQSLNTTACSNTGRCNAVDWKGKWFPPACAPIGTAQPQNNVRLWQDTNGPVDEANPVEFKKYMERRLFRSYNNRARCPIPSANCNLKDMVNANGLDMRGMSMSVGCPQGDSADDQIPFYERAHHHNIY
jgi:hypothetical protein